MANLKDIVAGIFAKHAPLLEKHGIKLGEDTPAAPREFATEGKLADGTPIYSTAAALEVGADVFTKDESGAEMPVPMGEYPMDNGQTIVVDEAGLIVEVKATEVDMSSEETASLIESLVTRLDELEGKFNAAETARTEAEAKLAEVNVKMAAVKVENEKLKATPAAPSTKQVPAGSTNFKAEEPKKKHFSQMTLAERITEGIKSMKN
jgi:hypothetical protein